MLKRPGDVSQYDSSAHNNLASFNNMLGTDSWEPSDHDKKSFTVSHSKSKCLTRSIWPCNWSVL